MEEEEKKKKKDEKKEQETCLKFIFKSLTITLTFTLPTSRLCWPSTFSTKTSGPWFSSFGRLLDLWFLINVDRLRLLHAHFFFFLISSATGVLCFLQAH